MGPVLEPESCDKLPQKPLNDAGEAARRHAQGRLSRRIRRPAPKTAQPAGVARELPENRIIIPQYQPEASGASARMATQGYRIWPMMDRRTKGRAR
jgi:hypothetical protein